LFIHASRLLKIETDWHPDSYLRRTERRNNERSHPIIPLKFDIYLQILLVDIYFM